MRPKKKIRTWKISKDKLLADSYFSELIINDDLKMGVMSCGNFI